MFPGGKKKAFAMSFDDGAVQDIKLVGLLNKYGIKGTFSLSYGKFATTSKTMYKGKHIHRLDRDTARNIYVGHEVASHGFSHVRLTENNQSGAENEIFEDVKGLESLFNRRITGFAYPYGQYDDHTISILQQCGIRYARTAESSYGFRLPENLFKMQPTCRHTDTNLYTLLNDFLHATPVKPMLFLLWGHSFEFDGDDNWDMIEELCDIVSGREELLYGTISEILGFKD